MFHFLLFNTSTSTKYEYENDCVWKGYNFNEGHIKPLSLKYKNINIDVYHTEIEGYYEEGSFSMEMYTKNKRFFNQI